MNSITNSPTTLPPTKYRMGMATMEMPIIKPQHVDAAQCIRHPARKECGRMHCPPLPPPSPYAARVVLGMPTLFANGTNWLITIRPAAQPNAYATHIK